MVNTRYKIAGFQKGVGGKRVTEKQVDKMKHKKRARLGTILTTTPTVGEGKVGECYQNARAYGLATPCFVLKGVDDGKAMAHYVHILEDGSVADVTFKGREVTYLLLDNPREWTLQVGSDGHCYLPDN